MKSRKNGPPKADPDSALRKPASQIDDQERARRKAAVDYARGSVRFEGFVLSPEVEKINRQFVEGELTGDEHVAAIKAIYDADENNPPNKMSP